MQDRYKSAIKYTTDDGQLTIEDSRADDGLFRLFAANDRIIICFEVQDITVIDDSRNDSDLIQLMIKNKPPIYLKSAQEATEIATFLGVGKFCYEERGNNLIPVSQCFPQ